MIQMNTQNTGQMYTEVSTMAKPTTSTATPQRGDASGKKRKPPATVAGGGGLQSSSLIEPEHTENIPAQHTTHNPNFDRGESENREDVTSQESRTPPSRDSRGGSEDRDDAASEPHFNRDLWFSQVFSEHSGLESSSKLVLLALGYLFNQDGECWPTRSELAALTELSERTIIAHLDKVEAAGWIETDRNFKSGGKRAILYKALGRYLKP